jgi:hypothetical protein
MRNAATLMAVLLALVSPGWAQQTPKDKPAESSKPGASETCEIRAYLLDKTRETVNIVGISAVLIVEDKDGAELLIPLQVITTKTGEKNALQSNRAPRVLEGTEYVVSLMTLHPPGSRRSEAGDADRRQAKGLSQDLNGKQEGSASESDKTCFTLEGPYFKADLTPEQRGAFTCEARVRFTIKGTNHTASGFSCSLSKERSSGAAACPLLAEECHQIERHLKANEMAKALVVVDRVSASVCGPCAEKKCNLAQHGCKSCCKDLRTAIAAGMREKALEALEALKAKCSACHGAPKPELQPKPENK